MCLLLLGLCAAPECPWGCNCGQVLQKWERELEEKWEERIASKSIPTTSAPLTTKSREGRSSHFTHMRKWSSSHLHAPSFFFPNTIRDFTHQPVVLDVSFLKSELDNLPDSGSPLAEEALGIQPRWWSWELLTNRSLAKDMTPFFCSRNPVFPAAVCKEPCNEICILAQQCHCILFYFQKGSEFMSTKIWALSGTWTLPSKAWIT